MCDFRSSARHVSCMFRLSAVSWGTRAKETRITICNASVRIDICRFSFCEARCTWRALLIVESAELGGADAWALADRPGAAKHKHKHRPQQQRTRGVGP